MHDAWQIGRPFGIPLRVHISWLIVFGLISWSLAAGYFPAQLPDLPVWSYWLKAVIAAAMFFASLVLHVGSRPGSHPGAGAALSGAARARRRRRARSPRHAAARRPG